MIDERDAHFESDRHRGTINLSEDIVWQISQHVEETQLRDRVESRGLVAEPHQRVRRLARADQKLLRLRCQRGEASIHPERTVLRQRRSALEDLVAHMSGLPT